MASGAVDFPEPFVATSLGDALVPIGLDRHVFLTHVDKAYFPSLGYTKGDLLTYYREIAPLLLPHLAGRALSLRRFPDGIDGTSFYEKRCPSNAPDWLETATIPTKTTGDTITYCTAADVESLLWIANLGCVGFHPWLSRTDRVDAPELAVFDLDRHQGATWEQVVSVAGLLRAALDRLGLAAYPKTSGSTGLHVYVPIDPRYRYARVKRFVRAVADEVVAADPGNATTSHERTDKAFRVLLDVDQNGYGRTMASVYSVRPTPSAAVSTPVAWEELGDVVPEDFTIATIWERLRRTGDVFVGTLTDRQRLEDAERILGLEP